METRRLMIAAFASALILVVWQSIFPPVPPVQDREDAVQVESVNAPSTVDSETATDPPASDSPDVLIVEGEDARIEPDAPREMIQADKEEIVRIETEEAIATFSNKGAVLLNYELKDHALKGGQDLDLVRYRGKDLYPFAIVSAKGGSALNSALFAWQKGVSPEGQAQLTFSYSGEKGVAEKVFRWGEEGFVDVELRVEDLPGWGALLGPGLNNEEARSTYGQTIDRVVGYKRGGELDTIKVEKQEDSQILSARTLDWITLEDNFFLVAAVPQQGVAEVEVRPVLQRAEVKEGSPRFLPLDTSSQEEDLRKELLLILAADGEQMSMTTYMGAKTYSYLSTHPYGLEDTVRWGAYLGFLAKPLYLVLEWIHSRLNVNYGIAIMLTTLLLRLCFYPLTHKSQESMGKMQELNPKIQGIRNKYRSKLKDKQGRPNPEAQRQMNEEVMAVYRTAGVNPASGCLPMLLQMPVFFAFFRLLTTAVELRGAEFALWITDLSQPDPYWVLPILMGATSIGTQKMMPTASTDPMQRRIMQLMPIMFTAFAFTFPSGLVLYWATNNVLTMGQQFLINKKKARKAAEAAA